jgi:hypothetical protein
MKTLLKDNRSSVKTQYIFFQSEQLPMTEFSLTLLDVGIVIIPGYSTMILTYKGVPKSSKTGPID